MGEFFFFFFFLFQVCWCQQTRADVSRSGARVVSRVESWFASRESGRELQDVDLKAKRGRKFDRSVAAHPSLIGGDFLGLVDR